MHLLYCRKPIYYLLFTVHKISNMSMKISNIGYKISYIGYKIFNFTYKIPNMIYQLSVTAERMGIKY